MSTLIFPEKSSSPLSHFTINKNIQFEMDSDSWQAEENVVLIIVLGGLDMQDLMGIINQSLCCYGSRFNSNLLNNLDCTLYGRNYWKPVETVFLLSDKWDNVQRASHYGGNKPNRLMVAEFGITLIIFHHNIQPTKRSSSQEFFISAGLSARRHVHRHLWAVLLSLAEH